MDKLNLNFAPLMTPARAARVELRADELETLASQLGVNPLSLAATPEVRAELLSRGWGS